VSNGICKAAEYHSREPHQQVEDCVEWTPIPPAQDQSLRERFLKVVLGAGYSRTASEHILDQWYDFYMNGDISTFVKMLEDYERDQKEEKCKN
jgi:hypothetical protein